MEINKCYNEDCLDTMKQMPDNFIDLIVTSPPYDDLRKYNGYSFNFNEIAKELYRILKIGGVLVWIINDSVINNSESLTHARQAIYFVDQYGFNLHDTMIYKKKNFSHPEKIRYHQTFEYMLIFSKGKPKTFNPLKDRKNICSEKQGCVGSNTSTQVDGSKLINDKKINTEYGMRHNVWEGNTRGQEEMGKHLPHPAMMPKWLARDHILSWSNEGDLVYDPFMGSGTTAEMAILNKRNWMGSEISEQYMTIINEKLKEA